MITNRDLDAVESLCNQMIEGIKRVRADRKIHSELDAARQKDGQWHYDDRLRGESGRTAWLKRRSMDLTRALAELRKP